ncbi:MAG: amino acid ABC transporter substrate-binding protein [Anaerolineae bacterium]|nr:amino acid ABC transporter substrate-binding protein [Anaerolineae bacterium]
MRHRYLALAMLLLAFTGCITRADPVARIQAARVLRVAFDPSFPPFEFVDATDNAIGIDVDLGVALAESLGVKAHFVTTTYDGLYDALIVGRADVIISALYPDPTRTRDFVFSTPYFNAGEMLVAPQQSSIAAPEDLSGRRLAVVFGTDGHMVALGWEERLTPSPVLVLEQSAAEALEALAAGEVEAAVVDGLAARAAAKAAPLIAVLVTDEPYVIAARSTDAALIEAFDETLDVMRGDGSLELLLERWVLSEY